MDLSFFNTRFLPPVLELMDQKAGERSVDRAMASTGLSRDILTNPPGFIPYRLIIQLAEKIARLEGEPQFGILIGKQLPYTHLGAYADYVLATPNLESALQRGQRALDLVSPGLEVDLKIGRECILLQIDCGPSTSGLVGVHHFHESIAFLLIDLVRQFAGDDWVPRSVKLSQSKSVRLADLEDHFGCPVTMGAKAVGIVIPLADLLASNPRSVNAKTAPTIAALRRQIGMTPPRSDREKVMQIIELQTMAGDCSEDAVGFRMGLGKRSIQRKLQAEGTTFRQVRKEVMMQRGCQLLSDTNFSVADIAAALGYTEANSFRRSFRKWTGLTPTQYRKVLGNAQVLRNDH